MSGPVDVLAPCPFCGHDDIRRDNPEAPDNNGIVYCDQCSAHALSADAWNMRTHSAAATELIEAGKQLLPRNLCLNNPRWPDSTEIPLTTTLGELRAFAAALANVGSAS